MAAAAIDLALAAFKDPGMLAELRERPLPADIGQVIRIAAGESGALQSAQEMTGLEAEVLSEACVFLLQQLLFAPQADSYRVLGTAPDAPSERLREHYRWLMKWLHPDRNQDGWEAVYADRVNVAWQDLKTADRRAEYDLRRQSMPTMPVAVAVAARRRGSAAVADARAPLLSGTVVRRLPALVLGTFGILALALVAGLYWAQSATERELADRLGAAPGPADLSDSGAQSQPVDLPNAEVSEPVAWDEPPPPHAAGPDAPAEAAIAAAADLASAPALAAAAGVADAADAPAQEPTPPQPVPAFEPAPTIGEPTAAAAEAAVAANAGASAPAPLSAPTVRAGTEATPPRIDMPPPEVPMPRPAPAMLAVPAPPPASPAAAPVAEAGDVRPAAAGSMAPAAAQSPAPAAATVVEPSADPALPGTAGPRAHLAAVPAPETRAPAIRPPPRADAEALVREFAAAYAAGDLRRFDRLFSAGANAPAVEGMRLRLGSTEMRFLEIQQLAWTIGLQEARARARFRETYVPRGTRKVVTESGAIEWIIRLDAGAARIAALARDGRP